MRSRARLNVSIFLVTVQLLFAVATNSVAQTDPGNHIRHDSQTQFDIKSIGDSVVFRTQLLEGFVYSFPLEFITSSEEIDFSSLSSQAVCNCIQMRFQDTTLSAGSPSKATLILKPKEGGLKVNPNKKQFLPKVVALA